LFDLSCEPYFIGEEALASNHSFCQCLSLSTHMSLIQATTRERQFLRSVSCPPLRICLPHYYLYLLYTDLASIVAPCGLSSLCHQAYGLALWAQNAPRSLSHWWNGKGRSVNHPIKRKIHCSALVASH
jgi:hypothetical protein